MTPIRAAQAAAILGVARTDFWRIVHAYNVPRFQYGPRLVRFPQDAIEELRAWFLIRTPADARRVTDARHKFSWSPK